MVGVQHICILDHQATEFWPLTLPSLEIKGSGKAGSYESCHSRLMTASLRLRSGKCCIYRGHYFEELDEIRHRPSDKALFSELMILLEDEGEHPSSALLSFVEQLVNAWTAA